MKTPLLSFCFIFLAIVAGCADSRAVDTLHTAQARANHERRLAWQRKHPKEYASQRKAQKAEAVRRAKQQAAESARNHAIAKSEAARQYKESHPCDTAVSFEKDAADADGHQQKFDLSVSGLHYADLCDNDDLKVVLKGYLLSFKAGAEHYLSSGDSDTDMDQAETLLAECQTLPAVYGTHAGAQCESQEETDIRTKTNWEMENY